MRALYSGGSGAWKNDLLNSVALTAGKKLSFTPTVTGNRRQFTIMCNVRRTTFGSTEYILSAYNGSAAYWHFNSDDTLDFGLQSGGSQHVTTKKFRDTEPMFLGLAFDSVARTVKMVHNDQEIDSFSTATAPVAYVETVFNMAGTKMELGAYNNAAGVLGANVSDFVILDGEVLTPQEMINYRTQNVPFGKNVITTTKKFTTAGKAARFYSLSRNRPELTVPIVNNESQYIERTGAAWGVLHTEILPSTGKYQIEVEVLDAANLIVGTNKATHSTLTSGIQTQGNHTGITWNGTALLTFNNSSSTADPTEWGNSAAYQLMSMYLDMDARTMGMAIDGVELGTPLTVTTDDLRLYFELHSLTGANVNFGQKDYAYPKAGYGPLQEPAKSDLKRCKFLPSGGRATTLQSRGLKLGVASASWWHGYSNFVMNSGLIYAEMNLDSGPVSHDTVFGPVGYEAYNTNTNLGADTAFPGHTLYQGGADTFTYDLTGGAVATGGGTSQTFLKFAINFTTLKFWRGYGTTWIGGGDPALGTGGTSFAVGDWRFYDSAYNSYATWNFGETPWNETPPTGFVGPASLDFDTLVPNLTPAVVNHSTAYPVTLDQTALSVEYTANAVWVSTSHNRPMLTGKYYAEAVITNPQFVMVGISGNTGMALATGGYTAADTYALYGKTSGNFLEYVNGTATGEVLAQVAVSGDVIGVAVDLDNMKIHWSVNDVFITDSTQSAVGVDIDDVEVYNFQAHMALGKVDWNFEDTFAGTIPAGYQRLTAETMYQPQLEYGPNGTQMLFEGSNLGASTAGNLLPWTLTGITSDDQLTDTPGDPYAVLNAIDKGPSVTLSNGGLTAALNGDDRVRSSQAFPYGGETSFAAKATADADAVRNLVGVVNEQYNVTSASGADWGDNGVCYHTNGQVYVDGTLQGTYTTIANGAVVEILTDGTSVWFKKDGTDIYGDSTAKTGGLALPTDSKDLFFLAGTSSGAAGAQWTFDFGQKGYVPPAGYKTLISSNKTTPKYHGRDTVDIGLAVGDGVSRTVNTALDTLDLLWTKSRSYASGHLIHDVVRGDNNRLVVNANIAEDASGATVLSGSTATLGANSNINCSGRTYVDWAFQAGGAPVLDTSGTIDAMLSVAPEKHLSIIGFQGTKTVGQTVPHGLPEAPELKIFKQRGGANEWTVISPLLAANRYLLLDRNDAQIGPNTTVNPETDTSTLIGLGSTHAVNSSNAPGQIIYAFRSVKGLCLVTSWKGNGGTKFIPLGFRMRLGMIKAYSRTGSWAMVDTERDPMNDGTNQYLLADDTSVEGSTTYYDITANGITLRTSSSTVNANNEDYIGVFFADVAGGGDFPAVLGN